MAFLEAHRLGRDFPGVKALDGVDLAIELGRVHVLAGENGAGKSTLVKLLTGADRPSRGAIRIDGRDPHEDPDLFNLIAYVPQETPVFIEMMKQVRADIETHKDWLSELDGVIGDGDHGVTMSIGWTAVGKALEKADPETDVETVCKQIASAFLDAVGASSGPLYATAFMRAGHACAGRRRLDPAAVVAFLSGAVEGLRERGKAKPGDKTMVDAWVPAVQQAEAAMRDGGSIRECLDAAVRGAQAGMQATAGMKASKGRSSKLGERSLGHMDPGAASTFVMLRAMAKAFRSATDKPQ